MNPPTKPSPFELASIAALLAMRDKKSSVSVPEEYIPQAAELLKAATLYLEKLDEAEKLEEGKRFVDTLGYNRFPFERLIQPDDPSEKETGKKKRTMVGNIETIGGLEKAIRRYFPKVDARRIIRERHMTRDEVNTLQAAQKQAVQRRAAKRVKGANAEKIQSA